jgi:hypothetical protein
MRLVLALSLFGLALPSQALGWAPGAASVGVWHLMSR